MLCTRLWFARFLSPARGSSRPRPLPQPASSSTKSVEVVATGLCPARWLGERNWARDSRTPGCYGVPEFKVALILMPRPVGQTAWRSRRKISTKSKSKNKNNKNEKRQHPHKHFHDPSANGMRVCCCCSEGKKKKTERKKEKKVVSSHLRHRDDGVILSKVTDLTRLTSIM